MIHFVELLTTKIALSLRADASKTRISYLWWILEPSLETAVFYLVFGMLMGDGTLSFVAFLLCGLVPWTWFARSIQNSMHTLKEAGWLLSNTRINPYFLSLVEVGKDFVKQGITFSFLFCVLLALGEQVSPHWLLLLPLIFLQLALITVSACLVASLVALIEDVKYLINTGLLLVMLMSGIFFRPDSILLPEHRNLFFLNPVASLLESYRQILLANEMPQWDHIAVIVTWFCIIGVALLIVFRRNRQRFAELILL
jgi:lipopolysaccharide transport system permease protein